MALTLDQIASSFEALPKGRYAVQITKVDAGRSGDGNGKIQFNAKVVGDSAHAGKTLVWSRSMLNRALFSLGNDLIAIGFDTKTSIPTVPGTDKQGNACEDGDADQLSRMLQGMIGKYYTADLGIRQYNGRDQNEITLVGAANPGGESIPGAASAPQSAAQTALSNI